MANAYYIMVYFWFVKYIFYFILYTVVSHTLNSCWTHTVDSHSQHKFTMRKMYSDCTFNNKHILAHTNNIINVVHFGYFTQFFCLLARSLPSAFRLFEIPTSNPTECEIDIDSIQLHTHYTCTRAREREYVHFIVWRQSVNGFSVFSVRMLETERTNERASEQKKVKYR